MNNKRGFKGVFIPAELWLDTSLNWTQKILLMEIHSLDNGNGCFASDEYLATFVNVKPKTISNQLTILRKLNLIVGRDVTGKLHVTHSALDFPKTGIGLPENGNRETGFDFPNSGTYSKIPFDKGNSIDKSNYKRARGKRDANLYTEPINEIWKNDPNPQQEKRTRRAIVLALKEIQSSRIWSIEQSEEYLMRIQQKRLELWKDETDKTYCKTSYRFFEDGTYQDEAEFWGPRKLNRNSKPIQTEIDHSKPF